MTHIQLQVGKGQQSVEQAFNNIQSLVRKCKDPALDADERDTLQDALRTLASRINQAGELEKELDEVRIQYKRDISWFERHSPETLLTKWQEKGKVQSDDESKSASGEQEDASGEGRAAPEES